MWPCTKMGKYQLWLGLVTFEFWKMVNQEASGSLPARFCTSYHTKALWLGSLRPNSLIPSATVLLVQQQHITDKDIILKWVHQFFLCSISHSWTDTDIILIAGAERSRGVVLGGAQVPLGSHGPRQTWLIWSTWRRRWMPSQEGPTLCPIDHHLLVQLYVDLEVQQPVLHLVDIASLWGTSQTSPDLAHLIIWSTWRWRWMPRRSTSMTP